METDKAKYVFFHSMFHGVRRQSVHRFFGPINANRVSRMSLDVLLVGVLEHFLFSHILGC